MSEVDERKISVDDADDDRDEENDNDNDVDNDLCLRALVARLPLLACDLAPLVARCAVRGVCVQARLGRVPALVDAVLCETCSTAARRRVLVCATCRVRCHASHRIAREHIRRRQSCRCATHGGACCASEPTTHEPIVRLRGDGGVATLVASLPAASSDVAFDDTRATIIFDGAAAGVASTRLALTGGFRWLDVKAKAGVVQQYCEWRVVSVHGSSIAVGLASLASSSSSSSSSNVSLSSRAELGSLANEVVLRSDGCVVVAGNVVLTSFSAHVILFCFFFGFVFLIALNDLVLH